MRKIKLKNGKEYTLKEPTDFPEGPIRDAYEAGYVDGMQFMLISDEVEKERALKERGKSD